MVLIPRNNNKKNFEEILKIRKKVIIFKIYKIYLLVMFCRTLKHPFKLATSFMAKLINSTLGLRKMCKCITSYSLMAKGSIILLFETKNRSCNLNKEWFKLFVKMYNIIHSNCSFFY